MCRRSGGTRNAVNSSAAWATLPDRQVLGGTVVLNEHIYESRFTSESGVRKAELIVWPLLLLTVMCSDTESYLMSAVWFI